MEGRTYFSLSCSSYHQTFSFDLWEIQLLLPVLPDPQGQQPASAWRRLYHAEGFALKSRSRKSDVCLEQTFAPLWSFTFPSLTFQPPSEAQRARPCAELLKGYKLYREKPDSEFAGLSRPAVCSLLSWNMESAMGGMWKTWLGKQEQKPYEVKGGAWITPVLVLKAGLCSQHRR